MQSQIAQIESGELGPQPNFDAIKVACSVTRQAFEKVLRAHQLSIEYSILNVTLSRVPCPP